MIEEKNPKDTIELLDSQFEYIVRELLDELAAHTVTVNTQPLDKSVDAGSRFVIQGINKLANRNASVWQDHVLYSELKAHWIQLSQYCDIKTSTGFLENSSCYSASFEWAKRRKKLLRSHAGFDGLFATWSAS